MAINTSNKSAKFENFTLHHIYFKNIELSEFESLYDQVNQHFYDLEASILTFCLIGEDGIEKWNKKIIKKVYGEINWPIIRIIDNVQNKYSGYFIAIEGVNLKTFVGSKSILKVFDTPSARFCYIGDVEVEKPNIDEVVLSTLAPALSMVGLAPDSIVQNWMSSGFENICKSSNGSRPLNTALAVKTNDSEFTINSIENPHQLLLRARNSSFFQISKIAEFAGLHEAENSIEDQINLIFDKVEKFLLDNESKWSALVIGYAILSDLKNAKIFKNICKERKIPAAPFMLIQRDFKANNVMFDVDLSFAKGDEE